MCVCCTWFPGKIGQGLFRISRMLGGREGSSPISPKYFVHLSLPKAISARTIPFQKNSSLARRFQVLLTRRHVLRVSRAPLVKKENITNVIIDPGITVVGSLAVGSASSRESLSGMRFTDMDRKKLYLLKNCKLFHEIGSIFFQIHP
jgi:hypothetical protein